MRANFLPHVANDVHVSGETEPVISSALGIVSRDSVFLPFGEMVAIAVKTTNRYDFLTFFEF